MNIYYWWSFNNSLALSGALLQRSVGSCGRCTLYSATGVYWPCLSSLFEKKPLTFYVCQSLLFAVLNLFKIWRNSEF